MPILTSNSRGSSQTGSATWTTGTNAYDGTYGTTTNTYATLSTNATSWITVSGYNFANSILDISDVNTVTVSFRVLVGNAGRWSNITMRPYLGTTAIGTLFTAGSVPTTGTTFTTTFSDLTRAQIEDPTFGIRTTYTKSGAVTDTISFDFADVSVNYSIETWGSLYL